MVTSVAVPALSRVEPFPAGTMTFFGLMVMGGAELLDPELHRCVVTLRFAGAAIALFGLALRFV